VKVQLETISEVTSTIISGSTVNLLGMSLIFLEVGKRHWAQILGVV
jgi:hypothetical protein